MISFMNVKTNGRQARNDSQSSDYVTYNYDKKLCGSTCKIVYNIDQIYRPTYLFFLHNKQNKVPRQGFEETLPCRCTWGRRVVDMWGTAVLE